MLARRYLLHHEERQSDKAESIAEVFQRDGRPNKHDTRRLVDGEEGVGHEGQVEHQGELEETLLQSAMGDIVARQDASDDEGGCSERAVAEADLLLAQSQALLRAWCLEEERHDLHHESLAEAIEDDEEQVIDDMILLEEVGKDVPQLAQGLPEVFVLRTCCIGRGGEDEDVVEAQGAHDDGDDEHDHHPGGSHPEVLDEDARQIDEATRGSNLGDIVERSLPADPFGLLLLGEDAHVGAVGGDVVGSPA